MKKICSVFCVLFVLLMIMAMPVEAARAYQTYTYSIDGQALHSPDAYTPWTTVSSSQMGLSETLKNASDLVVDEKENIYISDTDHNRIVVLNSYYYVKFEISTFVNDQGVPDSFTQPQGLFVTEDRPGKPGLLYVCDSAANRIVTFTKDGKFNSIIQAPQSELFDDDAIYWPVAVAVDSYDRLYVVSSETNEGIIVMTGTGEFTGFIGAQQTVSSVWAQIWKRFQSEEQRKLSTLTLSYPYDNIDINEGGFVYAVINDVELEKSMVSAITSKSKVGTYAPCKLLNPAGDEIMRRNGFWPPAGEIDYLNEYNKDRTGVSKIVDIACGPESTWSIVDEKRSKVYTYDYDGNLLFAFGDAGSQLGNMSTIRAITYQGDKLLILDGTGVNAKLVVFNRTEYGNVLIKALQHQNERQYDLAIEDWKEILMRNSNYDAAYIGIGQALFRSGDFEEAIEYYKAAYDTDNYSVAFKELRKEWVSKFFLLIPVVIIVACVAISKFLKYAAKINKKASVSGGKRTFKEELLFVFHLMFHPFDGFWDLKHEKRGSLRASFVFIALTIVALFYRSVGMGYAMNPQATYSTIIMQVLVVFVPVLLFVVANWCLTTLFDGEGSFKDIFIAIGYSLLPIVITVIPAIFFSNFVVTSEVDLIKLIINIGFIWAGFLIFFGMMVTHDYSILKNLLTTVGSILGMAFIMFLAILFTSLIMDIVDFVSNIVAEITYRL